MAAAVRYTDCMTPNGQLPHCRGVSPSKNGGPGRNAAFSLLEVLIVVALLLILTMMYWGGSSRSFQRGKQKICQGNLQKIFVAMQIYANESASRFPVVSGARTAEEALDLLVPRYTADTATFVCPGSSDSAPASGGSLRKGRISYAYFMGRRATDPAEALMSDRLVDTLPKAVGQNAFSTTGKPPGNNHNQFGGSFLFTDGHTDTTPASLPFSLVLTQGVVLLNP